MSMTLKGTDLHFGQEGQRPKDLDHGVQGGILIVYIYFVWLVLGQSEIGGLIVRFLPGFTIQLNPLPLRTISYRILKIGVQAHACTPIFRKPGLCASGVVRKIS